MWFKVGCIFVMFCIHCKSSKAPPTHQLYIGAYNAGIARPFKLLMHFWKNLLHDRFENIVCLPACPPLTFKSSISQQNSSHSQMHLQRFSVMKWKSYVFYNVQFSTVLYVRQINQGSEDTRACYQLLFVAWGNTNPFVFTWWGVGG